MQNFYDLSLEQRQRLTEQAILAKSTLMERWVALDHPEAEPWNARAALAAKYLSEQRSVCDIGCGTMTLRKYLRDDQRYVPVDVVARDPSTIVCDLNISEPPRTGADAVALLGVIEYLHQPREALAQLAKRYKTVVATYCVADNNSSQADRRGHAWVNDFRTDEIENVFIKARWDIVATEMVDDFQRMWLLSRRSVWKKISSKWSGLVR